jgi:hypothetical protein
VDLTTTDEDEYEQPVRYGVWATPSATNTWGKAGWVHNMDYDTGEHGLSYEEASARRSYCEGGPNGRYWSYEVKTLEPGVT